MTFVNDDGSVTANSVARRDGYAPCPTCHQYSHSIPDDATAAAFLHFHTMFDHRGDGMPTQYLHGEKTRDAAQALVARVRTLEAALTDIIGACDSFCDCDGDVVSSEVRVRARLVLGERG